MMFVLLFFQVLYDIINTAGKIMQLCVCIFIFVLDKGTVKSYDQLLNVHREEVKPRRIYLAVWLQLHGGYLVLLL